MRWLTMLGLCLALGCAAAARAAQAPDAAELLAAALDQVRGQSSYAEMTMTIHRPDWQRTSTLRAWTRGREDALIRFTAPARSAGDTTLKRGEQMWTFTPKLNRVIRLPFSMMAQSWGGSDFSYNDLSRSDQLLRWYDHRLLAAETIDGHSVYTIEAVPRDDAPVVWGKEVLRIRDDFVLLEHTFHDQALTPLKRLTAVEVGELGGRVLATRMRMADLEEPDHWTEVHYEALDFDVDLGDRMFTQFAMQQPIR